MTTATTIAGERLGVSVITPDGAEVWPVVAIELQTVPAGVDLGACIVERPDGERFCLMTSADRSPGDKDDVEIVGFVRT